MSQAKVDAHKEEKKNRQQEMAKAKQRKILVRVILIIVAAVIVFWIVFSAYRIYQNNKEVKVVPVNTSAIDDYFSGL